MNRPDDGGAPPERWPALPLAPRSVATFYGEAMDAQSRLGVPREVRPEPVKVVEAIPFDEDEGHDAYDPEARLGGWDRAALERQPGQRAALARKVAL